MKDGPSIYERLEMLMANFHANVIGVLAATIGSILTTKTGFSSIPTLLINPFPTLVPKILGIRTFGISTSQFKPKLESFLGQGGQAKVFKAKFHGKNVAMKYIPLDSVKNTYKFDSLSYGCHEFCQQEKFACTLKTML